MLNEYSTYDEVISHIEGVLGQEELPYRTGLRKLLEIISEADKLGCLEDCTKFFVDNKGMIIWGKIHRFCQDIQLKIKILNNECTLFSTIFDRMKDGDKRKERIDKSCSLLRFRVTGKPAFRDQVAKYKDSVRKGLSLSEKNKEIFTPTFISIFKDKQANKASRPKAKPVVIVCIATGATRTFSTQKECQEFLGISKPTFKSFAAGSSKLNKSWRLQ